MAKNLHSITMKKFNDQGICKHSIPGLLAGLAFGSAAEFRFRFSRTEVIFKDFQRAEPS